MLVAAVFVIFPFCMVFAALSDMVSMTIANRVSILLVVSFAVIAPLTGMEWSTFGLHLAAGAAVLSVTFVLFAIGGMGGGDAKLLASTAVWMGFGPMLVEYLVYGSLIGGALTLAILMYRKSPVSWLTSHYLLLRNFANPREGIPYGIALGIAGLLVFPRTDLARWAIEGLAGG